MDLYSLARNVTFNFFNLSQDRVMMLPKPSKPCELLTTILLVLLLCLFLTKKWVIWESRHESQSARDTQGCLYLFPSAGSTATARAEEKTGFCIPRRRIFSRANQIVCMAPGCSKSHITQSLLLIVFVV